MSCDTGALLKALPEALPPDLADLVAEMVPAWPVHAEPLKAVVRALLRTAQGMADDGQHR
jgi:hypothetical protein